MYEKRKLSSLCFIVCSRMCLHSPVKTGKNVNFCERDDDVCSGLSLHREITFSASQHGLIFWKLTCISGCVLVHQYKESHLKDSTSQRFIVCGLVVVRMQPECKLSYLLLIEGVIT